MKRAWNIVLILLFPVTLLSQISGYITEPVTGIGITILDPNNDNYTSADNTGFLSNDENESEIAFVPIPILDPETSSDVNVLDECGSTDFAGSENGYSFYSYYDATNEAILFRLRLNDNAPTTTSYSILVDTDELFGFEGNNADNNAVSGNPGFELEISLQTNNGLQLYDIDGSATPIAQLPTALPYNEYAQKSEAITSECSNTDYFCDFFIPISTISSYFPSIDQTSNLRFIAVSQNIEASVIGSINISDVAGANDTEHSFDYDNIWEELINIQYPTAPTAMNSGILKRTNSPTIDNNLFEGSTMISGSLPTEASGTTIEIFINNVSAGTTTTDVNGNWNISTNALSANDLVTATAIATDKAVSFGNLNETTVLPCTGTSSTAEITTNILETTSIIEGTGVPGATVFVYIDDVYLGNTIVSTSNTWSYSLLSTRKKCEVVSIYQTEQSKCISNMASATVQSKANTPTITGSYCIETSPSNITINGTGNGENGATIKLFNNSTLLGTTILDESGNWTATISASSGMKISAKMEDASNCLSQSAKSNTVTAAGKTSNIPTISIPVKEGTTSVSGTGTAGDIITLYINGLALVQTATVNTEGNWTIIGIESTALNEGDLLSATATSVEKCEGDESSEVTVSCNSPNTFTLTPNTYAKCKDAPFSIAISGTETNVTYQQYLGHPNKNGLAIGNTFIGTGNPATLESISLSSSGCIYVKAFNTDDPSCYTILNDSVKVTINPYPNKNLLVSDANICNTDVPVEITLSSSESGITYTLREDSDNTPIGTAQNGNNGNLFFSASPTETTIYNILAENSTTGCSVELTDKANITVTICPTNDAPIANDDNNITTTEDIAIYIKPLVNDTDPDGDAIIVSAILSGPNYGTATITNNDSIHYTPDPSFFGQDNISYEIRDDGDPELTSSATITITVNEFDDTPIANDNNPPALDEDTKATGNASSNDEGLSDGGIKYTLLNNALHGSATIQENGKWEYIPEADYNGLDHFTYKVCDIDDDCDSATVNLIIKLVDDQPIAVNDTITPFNEDTEAIGNVTLNDQGLGDGGIIVTLKKAASKGTAKVDKNGSWTYSPNSDYYGTDSFDYKICDANSNCDEGTVLLTIVSVNDVPDAINDIPESFNEDTDKTDNATNNDKGLGDGIKSASIITNPSHGSVTINNKGIWTYSPDDDYNGKDSFEYSICDIDDECSEATVALTILPINDVPVANSGSTIYVDEDKNINGDVLSNDSGLGDGGIKVSLEDSAKHGELNLNTDGKWQYTPNANYFGTESFSYKVCDRDGDCGQTTISIIVNSINDVPSAYDKGPIEINEDNTTSGDVTNNVTGTGDGGIEVSVEKNVNYGILTLTNEGKWTYKPNDDYNGSDSFTYKICDSNNDCADAKVSFTIAPINDIPKANPDNFATSENINISNNVSTNDTGLGDGILAYTLLDDVLHGTLTFDSDGSFTYEPNKNFNGSDSFTYKVCDIDTECSDTTVSITVSSINDNPIANNDNPVPFDEDTNISGNVLSNDEGLSDGGIKVQLTDDVANGVLHLNNNGAWDYTPNANYYGIDSFSYKVCDIDNDCSEATVSLTINSVNDIPIAANDIPVLDEDSKATGNVLSNDTGLGDGGIITTLKNNVKNGTLELNENGTWVYTPNTDYFGQDSFEYIICDSNDECDTGTVTLTILSVDDFPKAGNESITINEDEFFEGNVLDNDTGLGDGNILTELESSPQNGVLIFGNDGAWKYTPKENYFGQDVFTYSVYDGDGDNSEGNVTITIKSVNDLPTAKDDNPVDFNEDNSAHGNVLTNDTGLGDGDISVYIVTDVTNGILNIDSDGKWMYTPNADYFGNDSFTYKVCDKDGECDNADVALTILSVNDIPIANDDNPAPFKEDNSTTGNVLSNDTGLGDGTISVSLDSDVSHGTLELNNNGSWKYEPDADYYGSDQFTYKVYDRNGDFDRATVTLVIENVNDIPVAIEDFPPAFDEDNSSSGDVTENDLGLGDGNYIVSLIANVTHGNLILNKDGTWTYTPFSNYNGTDEFYYKIREDEDSSYSKVNLTITAVNDEPKAEDDIFKTAENTVLHNTVSGNETGLGDGGIKYTIITNVSNGKLTLESNGLFTYIPDNNFNGSDSFTYKVCDIDHECSDATVSITISNIDDSPIANDDSPEAFDEDNSTSGDVSINDDGFGDGGIVFTVLKNVNHGVLDFKNDGTWTYTPNKDYNGSDTFSYQVCDADTDCNDAEVSLTINSVNDSPIANDDNPNAINEDEVLTGNVIENDTDLGDGGVYTTIISNAINGFANLKADGTFSYTPNENYNGNDSFEYEICDADGDCSKATVSISINPVNDLPMAGNISLSTTENKPISTTVSGNVSGIGDGGIVFSTISSVSNGTLEFNTDGSFIYTPETSFYGSDQFKYQVCDIDDDCDSAIVNIQITNINNEPVAVDDYPEAFDEDTEKSGNVSLNDSGFGDGGIVYSIETNVSHGKLSLQTDGTWIYIPNADYNGTDLFTYSVCDVDGDCKVGLVTLKINAVNDIPHAVDDIPETILEETNCDGSVSNNDTDLGDGNIIYSVITSVKNGTLLFLEDGSYTYRPYNNFYGKDTLWYKVCDTDGDCDIGLVVFTVENVNDAPTINGEPGFTQEDISLVGHNILKNDFDIESDSLIINTTPISAPQHGEVTIYENGTIDYTPDINYFGNDTIEYQVCDNGIPSLCGSAKLIISIRPINDAPDVNGEEKTILEDNEIIGFNLLENDSDIDGDTLTLQTYTVSTASHGKLTLHEDGTMDYIPNENFYGTDAFEYSVCDNSKSPLCETALCEIIVQPVNDKPQANTDNVFVEPGGNSIVIDVQKNDIDIEDDKLITSIVSYSRYGEVSLINEDSILFVSDIGYQGIDTITYAVCDDNEISLCDTGFVFISTLLDDVAPIAQKDSLVLFEDTQDTIDILENDYDNNGDPLTLYITEESMYGTTTVLENGLIVYKPNTNYTGNDTIQYQVCDTSIVPMCDDAIVVITVKNVNDKPQISKEKTLVGNEDEPIKYNLLDDATDIDGDEIIIQTSPIDNVFHGNLTIHSDGNIKYTPFIDFYGSDSFTYKVCDKGTPQLCDTGIVFITIKPINDAPSAYTIHIAIDEDSDYYGELSDSVLDPEESTPVFTTNSQNSAKHGIFSLEPDGSFHYVPKNNYFGKDSVLYKACDGDTPKLCDSSWIVFTIKPIQDTPILQNDTIFYTIRGLEQQIIKIPAIDPDGDIIDVAAVNYHTGLHIIKNIASGDTSITIDPNSEMTKADTISLSVCDINSNCTDAIVIIRISIGNVAPIANTDNITLLEDTPIVYNVVKNDIDYNNESLQISIISNTVHGTIKTVGDSTIQYIPSENYFGLDSAQYEVCDNTGLCGQASIYFEIQSVNDKPVVLNNTYSYTTTINKAIDICIEASDIENDNIYVTTASLSIGSTSRIDGKDLCFTYKPNKPGIDTVYAYVSETKDGIDVDASYALIYVTVHEDMFISTENDNYTISSLGDTLNILQNDSINGDYTITISNVASGLNVSIIDSTIVYIPPSLATCGSDSITYKVCNNIGQCDSATVFLNIRPHDSDNDKVPDFIEQLPNENMLQKEMILEDFNAYKDSDDDNIPDFLDEDSDNDGIHDSIDSRIIINQCRFIITDTDSDMLPDFLDIDSDNDSIPDMIEFGLDKDKPVDTDNDSIPDYLDPDSDNDGKKDITEGVEDCDEDGIPNYSDSEDDCEPEVFIPDLFTPNGDGINEYFIIDGLDELQKNKLFIYNRWGTLVYEMNDYDNKWNGTTKHELSFGSKLPEGTYFYILEAEANNKTFARKGYIYLKR